MQPRHRGRRGAKVALAVGVVLAIGGCLAAPSPTTVPPTPARTASPTPSLQPTPNADAGLFGAWARLAIPEPLPHVFGGSAVRAAVAFGGGYVAVGGVNGGCCTGSFTHETHGAVWRSTDGLAWELEPNDPVFDLAWLTDLETDGRRLVAAGVRRLPSTAIPGDTEPHGATWSSGDGVNWEVVRDAPIFTALVATAGGFIGAADGDAGPELWRSLDGGSWDRVAGAELGRGVVRDLVVTPSGIVAVGWVESAAGARSAVSWRSTDGLAWRRSGGQASLAGAAMSAVAVSGRRLVAIGEGDAVAGLWWSDDGLAWTRVNDGPMVDLATTLAAVLATPAGFLLAGSLASTEDSIPKLWTSADGRSWTSLPVPEGVFGADVTAAVARGDALTVFQSSWNADASRPIPTAWDVR